MLVIEDHYLMAGLEPLDETKHIDNEVCKETCAVFLFFPDQCGYLCLFAMNKIASCVVRLKKRRNFRSNFISRTYWLCCFSFSSSMGSCTILCVKSAGIRSALLHLHHLFRIQPEWNTGSCVTHNFKCTWTNSSGFKARERLFAYRQD